MNEHIICDMFDTTGYFDLVYALPAKGPHVTRAGPCYCTKLDLPWEHVVMKLIPSGNVIQSIFLWQEEWFILDIEAAKDVCDLFCDNRAFSDVHDVRSARHGQTDARASCWPFLWTRCQKHKEMYMAWLLSWWCLPSINLFWTVHLVSFYWMLFCAFNISLCCGLCQEDPLQTGHSVQQ